MFLLKIIVLCIGEELLYGVLITQEIWHLFGPGLSPSSVHLTEALGLAGRLSTFCELVAMRLLQRYRGALAADIL